MPFPTLDRLIHPFQYARDQRAATERQKEADELQKAADELEAKRKTLATLAPHLLALHMFRQKYVSIGMPTNYRPTSPDEYPLPVFYQPDERFRHTVIVGSTGSGKTTTLCNHIAQDILYENGLIVLSAERDLFERLLPFIPYERIDDLIYFDPHDITSPIIGFNPFTREKGEDLDKKIGETTTILTRAMGGELGITMEPIIENAVAVLVHRPNATFADLIRLIDPANKTVRASLKTDSILDEDVRDFWKQYDDTTYYRKSHDAVRNRFRPFARNPISTVLATPSFSFKTVLNSGRHIIFLDLSQLPDTTMLTMGQLLLASIQQSLPARDAIHKDQRIPYYLYIDEAQKYAEDSEKSLIAMFNGARAFKLSVTLAFQSIANIPTKLMDTICDNANTTIALQMPDPVSAAYFAKRLRIKKYGRDTFDAEALQDLKTGYGYVQTPPHNIGVSIAIHSKPPIPLLPPLPSNILKARSKQNFGTVESAPSHEETEHATTNTAKEPPPPKNKKPFGITFD